MNSIILTNNDLVFNNCLKKENCMLREDFNFLDLLKSARDKIHKGYILVSHPLTSSLKPFEIPFRTIILEEGKNTLDFKSLEIIENSILTAEKFFKMEKERTHSEEVLNDYKLIDYVMIKDYI